MSSNELLKRIEKLEDELQDLTDNLRHVTTTVIILMGKIDPEGFDRVLNDDDDIDNVS